MENVFAVVLSTGEPLNTPLCILLRVILVHAGLIKLMGNDGCVWKYTALVYAAKMYWSGCAGGATRVKINNMHTH